MLAANAALLEIQQCCTSSCASLPTVQLNFVHRPELKAASTGPLCRARVVGASVSAMSGQPCNSNELFRVNICSRSCQTFNSCHTKD